MVGPAAVALSGLSARRVLCLTAHLNIVAFDDRSHIGHTTVTNFRRIPVEYFVQFEALWKVSVD